jgi:lipopolysaccharide transport system ATP-binding protein
MSSELAIRATELGKCYHIYKSPTDRLKQLLWRGRRGHFQEFWAVRDVSFEVRRGETVGIIGRNGSGKSTLLQMVCGTLSPTRGSVEVHGRVAAMLELGAGFNPEFTGRENVYLNGQVLGLTRRELDQRFDSIAAFADIGTFLDQPVKMYSSGMAVRLAFAVMAHVDADILVIDEALAVGDALFTQKCMRFLRAFRESGTLLFVSHDTGAVINLCQRALWLDQGRTRMAGDSKVVCDAYLEQLFESLQGKSAAPARRQTPPARKRGPAVDQRLRYINASPLRNDLELKPFDPTVASFGKGGASVTDVALEDEAGNRLAWVVGGETVTLTIRAVADRELSGAIIGFFVRDRLGQNLFGDNTVLASADEPLRVAPGEAIEARFVFDMPLLPIGDYSINVAIAEGNQAEHVAHQWIHDALIFKSHASSVTHSLIGIPMREIAIGLAAAEDLKEQSE